MRLDSTGARRFLRPRLSSSPRGRGSAAAVCPAKSRARDLPLEPARALAAPRSSRCSSSSRTGIPRPIAGTASACTISATGSTSGRAGTATGTSGSPRTATRMPSSTPAFFPLYPGLVALLGRVLDGHYVLAGVLLSLAACAAAFVLLYRLAAGRLGETARGGRCSTSRSFRRRSSSAVYSESLYLALVLGGVPARRARPVPRRRSGRRPRDADTARRPRARAGARAARLALGRSAAGASSGSPLAPRRGCSIRSSWWSGSASRSRSSVPRTGSGSGSSRRPGRSAASGTALPSLFSDRLGRATARAQRPAARRSRSPSWRSPSWPGGASARRTGCSRSSAWRSRSRSRPND